jgi:mRNA interferase MazF
VVTAEYVPGIGDLVWLSSSPQAGREQAGRRPAVVLSPRVYNQNAGLAIVCPITSKVKGYPFEVPMPAGARIQGVILADHLKCLDWRERQAEKAGKIPAPVLQQVRQAIATLLQFS